MIKSVQAIHIGLVLSLVTILSCTPTRDQLEQDSRAQGNLCPQERSKMCTRDYRPTCGTKENGEIKEYSNSCTACADPSVVSWVEGSCQP